MKILMISNMFPSKDYPTYGTFVKNFSDAMSTIYEVKTVVLTKKMNKTDKLIGYIKFYISIVHSLLFDKYDLVYVHYPSHVSLPLLIFKLFSKKKLIVNVHGSDVVPESKIGKFLLKFTVKLLSISDLVVVPSSYFKEYISKQFSLNENKIRIFPSGGVNTKCFYKRDNFDSNSNYLNITYISRIDTGKGWDIYLKSIQDLKENNISIFKNCKFHLVGSGSKENEMKELISKSNLSEDIRLLPSMSQKDLSEFLVDKDLMVFPSRRVGESLGLVGLEALAMSVPVIGSNNNGISSYVKDGFNGFTFNPFSHKELSEKIVKFANLSKSERKLMKLNAEKSAEKYLDSNIYMEIESILR